MTRIPPVTPENASLPVRLAYKAAARMFGEVPEPFAVFAHHPKLFFASSVSELAADKASTRLPVSVRELAVYRAAWTLGCSWCVDFGTMIQRLDGLDVDRLRDIDEYATSPKYSDDERAAIAYSDAMTSTPVSVTDEQVADLERRFGRAGVVELTYQIGLENMRARINSSLGITEQGFGSGETCRVPWADSVPSHP
ncbi:carboxymuconolactone decarboxylase family protein [Rhodococcoides kyotonense]|uniref:Alkylhydroperoxidase family enzyme, contains CxxC motif n=1 Tax=Rhodococcoides kyotonense TaxID=398843 RepID=A0A239EAA4_9NOCA|nr:carboxymuconolactone decarboxylase family protein [Rhodococcus kyotonensis]SNS40953.1 Alkylhydroperoxidase family enzyme, contains CxxC motif [Rhodococcus kyotonensis]